MEYTATAKYLRISTRKVRLVADAIRLLSPEQALQQLSRMPKRSGMFLKKIIDSALANAHGKNQKSPESLRFLRIDVSQGPSMKRWHAVSKGTAHAYKKRMTHIRVVLTDDVDITEHKTVKGGKR
ncbi:MAG: 50S ribosomal protein L22 [Candidatus Gottesmanbacteria bacterium GW2011_GWA2_44_17]|uniref:Large ribosomal subunit protein uL22 n=3 Tax=Candidatus Gottesmaniibacteriota TaxID=1752720 RepID=A0A0G1IP64_9BACT|nr:MAG: 50S ribosomal protein L22 [Microgenomates group bacterium GW2011_GWC1_43_11]KKT38656.1 MAG: 50S ribosomal protein L22 [Candidatus Gottesmanbacteria bacterium GW2011_GWB1_44_11c]KKT47351.1 MAG: 50S ribosomal protein L22 [Candidatus Gottesmanbacteria bacterium GW2011_GWA2_44_17]KKT61151.1 MAG: 50S ribosomal protein L22 [Candidatus Gottesmanbacteria bacterium GW2011_GWA1_44_24b]HCM82411.1 50S ribosomal protein L22 [Patescibacteria group bacterium]